MLYPIEAKIEDLIEDNFLCECGNVYKSKAIKLTNKLRPIRRKCDSCHDLEKTTETSKGEEKRLEQALDSIKQANIPIALASATLENWVAGSVTKMSALSEVSSYVETFEQWKAKGCGVVLFGTTGTGKSHLAVGMIKKIIEKGFSAKMIEAWELGDELLEYNGFGDFKPKSFMLRYRAFDMLVIDEIGLGVSSREKEAVVRILFDRMKYLKPTTIISNLSQEELFNYLGGQIQSRFARTNSLIITCAWNDYAFEN